MNIKKVSIRQYVDPRFDNMGLREYNQSVMSGEGGNGGFKEMLGYKQLGTKKFYLNGLNDHSLNFKGLKTEEKDAKRKEIEVIRQTLEEHYGKGTLDDTNEAFWGSISLEVRVPVKELNFDNPEDILTYYCILGGGFGEIAPSINYAKNENKSFKFYLHVEKDVAEIVGKDKRLRNKSLSLLETIYEEKPSNLFYISKNILPLDKGFIKTTPTATLYNELSDYITTEYVNTQKKTTAQRFIEATKRPLDELISRSYVREAIHSRIISLNKDKHYYFQLQYTFNYH